MSDQSGEPKRGDTVREEKRDSGQRRNTEVRVTTPRPETKTTDSAQRR